MITIRGRFQHSHFSIDDTKAPRDRQSGLSRTLPPEGSALGLQVCNKVQMVLPLCHLLLQVLSASVIPLQWTLSKAVNFLNSFPTSCPPSPLKLYQTIFWTCPSMDISWPRSPIAFVWPNPISRIWHGWWPYSGTESLAFWPPHSLGPHLLTDCTLSVSLTGPFSQFQFSNVGNHPRALSLALFPSLSKNISGLPWWHSG